jgi:hypothetical protein
VSAPSVASQGPAAEPAYLLTARAVRERAQAMLARAEAGELEHFALDWSRLPEVVERVVAVTRARHPDPAAIPPHSRWRHFGAGGIDRLRTLEGRLAALPEREALRARLDLVVVSVLLDAGAGARWCYREPTTGLPFARSEGLAVASFHAFMSGAFSSDRARDPLRADAAGLAAVTEEALAAAFQASAENPLLGLRGRVALLRRLGEVVGSGSAFEGEVARVGNLADGLRAEAEGGALAADRVLEAVLAGLGPIWPGRHAVGGVNLGDTWPHPQLGLVPFHKLSQWLTYSLLEPLEGAGLRIGGLGALTGLAEYRNGGLFLDGGVLVPRHEDLLRQRLAVDSPAVVEWRALTVALLDRTADEVRRTLGLDAEALPLVKVLEGGTWEAGRQIARERRPDGGPPLTIESDGTVF